MEVKGYTMTLQDFYAAVGGSYEEVIAILRKDERIVKFLSRFPADESYAGLTAAIAAGDVKNAFELAHKLKGVALNLGLKNLAATASAICEQYRGGTPDMAIVTELAEVLDGEHRTAVDAIAELTA